jgi:hypothetical protein
MRDSLRASPFTAFSSLPGGCDLAADSKSPRLLNYLIRTGNRTTRRMAGKNLRKLSKAANGGGNG